MTDRNLQRMLKISDAQMERLREYFSNKWNGFYFVPTKARLTKLIYLMVLDAVGKDRQTKTRTA